MGLLRPVSGPRHRAELHTHLRASYLPVHLDMDRTRHLAMVFRQHQIDQWRTVGFCGQILAFFWVVVAPASLSLHDHRVGMGPVGDDAMDM